MTGRAIARVAASAAILVALGAVVASPAAAESGPGGAPIAVRLTIQPATTQPATTQPATTQPASPQPASPQPASTQPASTQPATTQPATTDRFAYGIDVTSALDRPVDLAVTLDLPAGASGITTDGGQAAGPPVTGQPGAGQPAAGPAAPGNAPAGQPGAGQPAAGQAAGKAPAGQPRAGEPAMGPYGAARSLAWQARVAPRGSVTLRTTAVLAGAADRSVSTACVADRGSGRVLDCAAAVYVAPPPPAEPWLLTWGWALAAGMLALAGIVWGVRWLLRRPARPPRPVKDSPRRRSDGYGWKAAGLAVLAVVVLAAVAAIGIVPRMTSVAGGGSADGHGWVGPRRAIQVGKPASDDVVEFEVYRVSCASQNAAGQNVRTCVVTLALRNLTGAEQRWYPELQRLHVSNTSWVNPDPAATAAANGGVNVFAAPLRPTERIVAVLAFAVPAGGVPARLELREGVFARGVVLDVRT